MKRNIKLTIQYDGTKYDGWQKQGNTPNTIQETLETCIASVLKETIELHGSGRTDAGVHACGQVGNFHTSTSMTLQEMKQCFNECLPEDILISGLEEVPKEFHSRLSATKKTYQYRIWNGSVRNVFERRYVYQEAERLDLGAMRIAADFLVGTHDFRSFCSNKDTKKSTIRTVYSITIETHQQGITLCYCGNGFLYNMVRIMTGTLIEIGLGKRKIESISLLLNEKNREAAGFMAPAQGLSLYEVNYDEAIKRYHKRLC